MEQNIMRANLNIKPEAQIMYIKASRVTLLKCCQTLDFTWNKCAIDHFIISIVFRYGPVFLLQNCDSGG